MKHVTGLLVAVGLLVAAPSAAEMSLTIQDGKVTLICDDTPARQVLAEWSRLGQTKIVGAERLSGPPLTLRLEGVPEHQALQIVLRAASGYIVADRATLVANASRYDRILIMPPSAPVPASMAASRPAPAPPPAYQPQPVAEPDVAEDVGDQDQSFQAVGVGGERPPETTFDYANPQEFLRRRQELLQEQQLRQQQQQQQQGAPALFPGTVTPGTVGPPNSAAPTGVPTVPVGTARPGEIIRPPAPQQNFINPYGLPYNPQGQAPANQMEPDRAKYANPYMPTPQPPQQQDE